MAQMTVDDRKRIDFLLQLGWTPTQIANDRGRNKSTIINEIINRSVLCTKGFGCSNRIYAGNLIVRVPVKFSHVSGRKKIEASHPTEFQANSPILRAIARGMAWLRMLDEGKVSSIHDLADTLKLERKYVRYTLRLAFLSPRVIRAIMQGQEPDGLSLAALRRLTTANWAEQERFLGIDKLPNCR